MGAAHSGIKLPSLFSQHGPFHSTTYPLFLCRSFFVITGNTIAVREILFSGMWSSTPEVTQAIQFACPCTSLQVQSNLGTSGTWSLKHLSGLNDPINADSPSVTSVPNAADLLNSTSFRNLWRQCFIAG